MGSAIPFIIWIFCIGVAALIIGKALGDDTPGIPLTLLEKKEGFVDLASIFRVTACPGGTTSYILSNGDTNCCSGDVVGNKCNGRDVCSLSPDPYDKNLGSCSSLLASEWGRRAARFCPRSMNNYFGKMNRDAGSAEGCSASFPTSDGSQPSDAGQPKCKIYSNYNDEVSKQDSCANIKEMENLVCPTSNATKSFLTINGAPGKTHPLILKCGYLPPNGKSNGMPVDCMDDASVRRYLSVVPQPVSEEYLMNSVMFCGASKAYYIDGTLSAPPALDVPGSGAKAAACPPAPACPSAAAGPDDTSVCFKNGVKVGQRMPSVGMLEIPYILLSESECKSMGGTFKQGNGGDPSLCIRPGYSRDDFRNAEEQMSKKAQEMIKTGKDRFKAYEEVVPEILRKYTLNGLCLDASQSQGGASQQTGCVKGIGKRIEHPKAGSITMYNENECKSIGGTSLGQMCFNSPEAPQAYTKENEELFISAMKSGKFIVTPKNDAERESNKQFESLRDKSLGKKYTRNFDCNT